MHKAGRITTVLALFIMSAALVAKGQPLSLLQNKGGDVFVPIGKYIEQGNAYRLSAWFPDNLEVSILGNTNDCCSKNQAKEIMQAFFDANKPYKFEIVHKTDESLMKHAIGRLYCTNNNYSVTISVLIGENGNHIQILRIDSY